MKIHYNYTSDNPDTIIEKKNRVKELISRFTNNHTDYKFTTDINNVEGKYTLDLKITR